MTKESRNFIKINEDEEQVNQLKYTLFHEHEGQMYPDIFSLKNNTENGNKIKDHVSKEWVGNWVSVIFSSC